MKISGGNHDFHGNRGNHAVRDDSLRAGRNSCHGAGLDNIYRDNHKRRPGLAHTRQVAARKQVPDYRK